MYIRDIAVFADESIVVFYQGGFCQKFYWHTLCITEHLIAEIYQLIKTKNIAKVVFTYYHPDVFSELDRTRYDDLDGVIRGHASFDFDTYNSEGFSIHDRKHLISESLKTNLSLFCKEFSIDFLPFENAFRRIEERNYCFGGITKKKWFSPDKKHKIHLRVNYDLEYVDVEALLYKRNTSKAIGHHFVSKFRPSDGCVAECGNNVEWTSNTTLQSRVPGFMGKKITIRLADFEPIQK